MLKQAANLNGLPCIQAAGKRFAEGCFSVFDSSIFGIFLHPKAFEFVFCCCSRKGANQHQFVLLKQYKTNYDLISSFNDIKYTKKVVGIMYQNIFDTHSHYTDAAFDADREQVLASLPEKGVSHAMLAACNLEDSSACIQLAQQHADLLYASVGIHPEAEGTQPADYLQQLAELAAADCVKAIGEIGMDYHYEGYRKEAQMRLFQEQVDLAKQLHLPVIVHIRDATEDAMRVLKDQRPAGVVHCFSGSAETAKEVIRLGMYIGFTGVLTFKNAKKAIRALQEVPEDRLVLETDCPYMAPVPFRGSRCDSSMIYLMAEKVAECRQTDAQTVLHQTAANAAALYQLTNLQQTANFG